MLRKLSAASVDRFNLCPFAHQRSRARMMAADGWCYGLPESDGCPIGLSARPGGPRLLLRPGSNAKPATPRPAEAAGKSEHEEHTTATNHCETPKKNKKSLHDAFVTLTGRPGG
jgi:hypothetical protein